MSTPTVPTKILMLHTNLDDASIHLWVSPEALKRGDFERVYESFSGT